MAKPFSYKPGQSGNPNGRPKREWTIAGLIEEALEEEHESGMPWKKVMINKLVTLAVSGDIVAIKEVNQRLDGMPQQNTDITTAGKPIPIFPGTINVPADDGNQEDQGAN